MIRIIVFNHCSYSSLFIPIPMPLMPAKRALTACSRAEITTTLHVLSGTIPDDLQGHVYLNSPCGTVNSPTPFPKHLPDGSLNGEWGDILFNGDGMLFRFDLDQPGQVSVKSAILKTPCYWADEATKLGTDYHSEGKYFKGMGLARSSSWIGTRNQVNTAVSPFRFAPDQPTRLTANFDAGRPFELDPVSLALKTPVGYSSEWRGEFPVFLDAVFPLDQSTAHPSFDPETHEYFTVLFTKDLGNLIFSHDFSSNLLSAKEFIIGEFLKLEKWLEKIPLTGRVYALFLKKFIDHLHQKLNDPSAHFDAHQKLAETRQELHADEPLTNGVALLRWTGQQNQPLDRWNVVDAETGQPVVIYQTMHQTNLSRDYIVLVDSALKFALDLLENIPFPHNPWLDDLLRRLTTKVVSPETPLYIIRRADLKPGATSVVARSFMIPLETVHYSIDYENPNGQVTIHTAHNSASCAAEWLRPYDFLATQPFQLVLPNTVGLMACGEMDIGRIGKFIVDGDTGKIIGQHIIDQKGFSGDNVGSVKAHTWAVGLNTYRDIISAEKTVGRIVHNFWQSYGLDYRMLTVFMQDLYQDYRNRIIPVDKLLDYTRHGIPFCLVRQNTETMTLDDYYLFRMNENMRSIQFVPRRRAPGEVSPVHEQMDGYILCTMVNGDPVDLVADAYTREVWLFDAAKLSAGPVCKLFHDDLNYSFTIHSAWVPDCQSFDGGYNVDIIDDYNEVLSTFSSVFDPGKQSEMQTFMENNVYNHYPHHE